MPRRTPPRLPRRNLDYDIGFEDGYDEGYQTCLEHHGMSGPRFAVTGRAPKRAPGTARRSTRRSAPRKSRRKPVKLSTWQRYIKNKKNHIKLRSGKLNLKKMAVQYRKKHKK